VADIEQLVVAVSPDPHAQDEHGNAGANACEVGWYDQPRPVADPPTVPSIEGGMEKNEGYRGVADHSMKNVKL
jgi:hypothetical protein